MARFSNFDAEIVSILMNVMTINPYAHFFRSLRDVNIVNDSRVIISRNPVLDQRVYNAPTSDQVVAILVDGTNSLEINSPHITVVGKSDRSHRVMHYYGCYDPLQYPLLFPRGDSGWHQGLKKVSPMGRVMNQNITFPVVPCLVQNEEDLLQCESEAAQRRPPKSDKEVSCREYYAYKLQIRVTNYLLYSGRLLQQYTVDMYVKIENTRLDFFRRHQSTIRSELYQGIVDSLNEGHRSAAEIGKRIVLPASFIGGPRDIKKRYLNAMTLVQRFGKPDLFITMTCNPRWHEIHSELKAGEKAENRPDLCARIFHAKLKLLKSQIVEKNIFGPIIARVDVIEFQKRGLPHAHMLIIFSPQNKISTPEDFDKYVCAEIPGEDNPTLRRLVKQHMMHGPCGDLNPDCACMEKQGYRKICKFHYPKSFVSSTTCGEDSYPTYRRRNNGDGFKVRKSMLDNRWVIPYNPYLLLAFDCHINVEVCSTIKAVKYLYKYVYKGHDRVSFAVTNENVSPYDEVQSYQSSRWVSPPEAAWRIFGFDLFDISPSVIPLQIHLPDLHPVTFRDYENLRSVSNDENRQKTMLTEFFIANEKFPDHKYLYCEFPEHFVWDQRDKSWKQRKQRKSLGRVAYVNPLEGERYYLRLLLSNVRGPLSFNDLLTVNGHSCTTFKDASMQMGLLEHDGYVESCMDEATAIHMPHTLRRLFATLLIFCSVPSPKALWDMYYVHLSEDFNHLHKIDESQVLQSTSIEIQKHLKAMGKSLKDYNLHEHLISQSASIRATQDIKDALNSPVPKEYVGSWKLLNKEQRIAYKCIMEHVKRNKPGAFFIDGPGGTGKTFLYCALYAKIRLMKKIVLPTATSVIAASNIPTGRTTHSRFKLPLDDSVSVSCNISKQSSLAELLRQTSLIIWYEASMAKRSNIESLNTMLQDICKNNALFGGKIIVFGGDFRQVLPVMKTQREAIEASLVSSYIWPQLTKFKLTENIRALEDPAFSDFLLQLGNGSLQTDEHSSINLQPEMVRSFNVGNDSNSLLISHIFPEIQHSINDSEYFNKRAILTPKNEDVDNINNELLRCFPGSATTYRSFDTVLDDQSHLYPVDFLNTLCPSGMSPHELVLKPNCPVILLRNLDPPSGLCNGTRLICKKFFKNIIHCQITMGHYKGEHVFLPRITLRTSPTVNYPFQFERKQFPIKLCFAMTINKSQGQTLEKVAVYLRQPCFSHGQLYVALSRARNRSNVTVLKNESDATYDDTPTVVNVVSFELLRKAGVL